MQKETLIFNLREGKLWRNPAAGQTEIAESQYLYLLIMKLQIEDCDPSYYLSGTPNPVIIVGDLNTPGGQMEP